MNDNNVRCIAVDGGIAFLIGASLGANTGDINFGENGGG